MTLRLFTTLLALSAILFPASSRADPEDIAAAARGAVRVVLLANDGGQLSLVGHGSGVAIAPDTILTNAHVIEEAASYDAIRIAVVPSEGRSGWFARVVSVSPRNDLALLKLTEPGSLPVATLFTGAVPDGADVYAVGYPGNVDMAQGLNIGDIVTPTPPVKTRGNVSTGRPSKQFDTILHTAAIGSGNSGGPLLDACGRVIGLNSFGTLSGEADSEFYFAVSMREIGRFLLANRLQPRSTATACQSLAEFARLEAERVAGEQAKADVAARKDAARTAAEAEAGRRAAQLEVITERENRMALAGLAVLLALASGGIAILFQHKGRGRDMKIAGGLGVLLLGGAVYAWLSRPPLSEIEERASQLAAAGTDTPAAAMPVSASTRPADAAVSGPLLCMLDSPRSRVTVSDTADLAMDWQGGCADGKTAYVPQGSDAWARVIVDAGAGAVSVSRFEPASGTYTLERHYPGFADMAKLGQEIAKAPAPACPASRDSLAALAERDGALRALLPERPVETLVYRCRADASPPR